MIKNNKTTLLIKQLIPIVIIAIAVAVALFLFMNRNLISVDSVKNNPDGQLNRSLDITLQDIAEAHYSPLSTVSDLYYNGSIEIPAVDESGNAIGTYTVYQNLKNKQYGSKWSGQDGSFWTWVIRDNKLAFTASNFKEASYGIDLTDIENTLKNSEVPKAVNRSSKDILSHYHGNYFGHPNASTIEGVIPNIAAEFLSVLQGKKVTVREDLTIPEEQKVVPIILTYDLDHEQSVALYERFVTFFDTLDNGFIGYTMNTVNDALAHSDKEIQLPEENMLERNLYSMALQIDQIINESDTGLTIQVSLNPKTETVIKIEIMKSAYILEENVNMEITVDFGLDAGRGEDISASYILDAEDIIFEDTNILAVYHVEENNAEVKQEIIVDIKSLFDERRDKIYFHYQKGSGAFTAAAELGQDTVSLDGKITAMGSEVRLTAEKYTHNTDSVALALQVKLIGNVEQPMMPAYTDVAGMKAKDIKKVYETLTELIPAGLLTEIVDMGNNDMKVYESFHSNYDYDGDGDTGDAEDKELFEIFRDMMTVNPDTEEEE